MKRMETGNIHFCDTLGNNKLFCSSFLFVSFVTGNLVLLGVDKQGFTTNSDDRHRGLDEDWKKDKVIAAVNGFHSSHKVATLKSEDEEITDVF